MGNKSAPRNYLVWGTNGVSDIAALRVLVEQPVDAVGSILAVSRRPPLIDLKDKRIKFVSVDILNATVEKIAEQLTANGGDKVNVALHYTYIEKKDAQELLDINHILLSKALDATPSAAEKWLKHFHLQTGYKWYLLHLTNKDIASPVPYKEDAPRGPRQTHPISTTTR